jgi:hypothetical protein
MCRRLGPGLRDGASRFFDFFRWSAGFFREDFMLDASLNRFWVQSDFAMWLILATVSRLVNKTESVSCTAPGVWPVDFALPGANDSSNVSKMPVFLGETNLKITDAKVNATGAI